MCWAGGRGVGGGQAESRRGEGGSLGRRAPPDVHKRLRPPDVRPQLLVRAPVNRGCDVCIVGNILPGGEQERANDRAEGRRKAGARVKGGGVQRARSGLT